MADILGDEEGQGFDFEFEQSVEDAEAPPPLPEGDYDAEVTDSRLGVSNLTGRRQLLLTIVVPVENFPADFSPDNAPDGVRLVWFSPDIDDSKRGRWAMKQVCRHLKVPMTNRFRSSEFVGKRVRVTLGHRTGQDEVTYNNIKGTPEAVD